MQNLNAGAYRHKNCFKNEYGEAVCIYETRYSPELAQSRYEMNMTTKGPALKLGNDYAFVEYIEKRVLVDKLSPCAALGEIKRNKLFKTTISKTTLYRYISQGVFLNLTLEKCPRGKAPKRYKKVKAKRAPKGASIEKRSDDILSRTEFGNWEMDCVCGSTLPTLLVLTERKTRKEIIFPMPNQKAESVVKCLNSLERWYGKLFRKVFKTITVDNGSEFSDFSGLERSIYRGRRTSVYYCHPYSAYERGSNERLNRDIRRLIPKGSDLRRFSPETIREVEDWLNAYPREMFGYATADEMFDAELSRLN